MDVLKEAKARKNEIDKETREAVTEIIEAVRTRGDKALREYSEKFDGYSPEVFKVEDRVLDAVYESMPMDQLADIEAAIGNVKKFAEAQRNSLREIYDVETSPGVSLGHKIIPVDSCLCYIPGGNYPLFSTAIMLIIPAKVAGVKRICACAPGGTHGVIDRMTLMAMYMAGADEIYCMGGAQAVAAFSYGTEEIKPVDLIVGPGNKYVAEAKRQCYGKVGIDFVAGPSEVMVVADGTGDPHIVAADLLAQAEHDVNAKSILVSTDREFAEATIRAVDYQLNGLATREIAWTSWKNNGEIYFADTPDEAITLCNEYAPEHLELNISPELEEYYINGLRNYGSLFIGENTAEVFGDYITGPNHTLPTVGAARYTGGLSVLNFLKVVTYQRMTKAGASELSDRVARMARVEGLEAHARAAEKRK